jgi:predicted transcriptional regulator of viral defense system
MNKIIFSKTVGPISAQLMQKLFEQGKLIFTLNEACEIYGHDIQKTSQFLRDLVNRGIVARLKAGLFLILQIGQENTQLSNWPIIAKALAENNEYCLSHYSAMRLHGMTTHPLVDVIITMPKRRAAKKIYNNLYKFIYSKPEHFWGLTELWVTKQDKVFVSDLERTILDALTRPDLCGGLKEIVRGIWVKHAHKYHTLAAVKRLGFILVILDLGIEYIPTLEHIIASKKDYILLDPNGPKLGKYLSRWRVQINMDIDEIKASVWG